MNEKTINIGGKERLACFGLQSVMELQEHYGGILELGKAFQKQDFSLFSAITYYTLKSGENSKGNRPDFTITEVYDWVFAKKNDKDLVDLIALFSDSMSKYVTELTSELESNEDGKDVKKK